ncbi:hypothetical protein Tco_0574481 [Tanacetum coccineum]
MLKKRLRSISSVRRPSHRDSSFKNSVLSNTKNSSQKVEVSDRTNKKSDVASKNVDSNKKIITNDDIINALIAKNGKDEKKRLDHLKQDLMDVVFDGAFGGVGDEEVVVGESVVVISSSLDMLINSCLGGIMVSLIFLEGLDKEAFMEFMVK